MSAMSVTTLGTAGGPRWWRPAPGEQHRAGIATAVSVGDATYLIDAGAGTWINLARAGIDAGSVRCLALTHLHSDHVADLAALPTFGLFELAGRPEPLQLIGPGDRGGYPGYDRSLRERTVGAGVETPGTTAMFTMLVDAFATDLNERILDSRRPRPDELIRVEDIAVPASIGYHPATAPTPDHAPFRVYEDDRVRITAALVAHPPIAPAFAFRVDADGASVTISGDTAPCANVARLAEGCDLLLHEAIDLAWVRRTFPEDSGRQAALRAHHLQAHTSAADAVRIADEAGARQLALHHLVPGNTPHSVWRDAVADCGRPVTIAADLQRFSLD